jgi:hypothetical protein
MSPRFTPEFVEHYLFGRGLQLKDYVVHVTPISETLGFVDEEGRAYNLMVNDGELFGLMMRRLRELGVREVVATGRASSNKA